MLLIGKVIGHYENSGVKKKEVYNQKPALLYKMWSMVLRYVFIKWANIKILFYKHFILVLIRQLDLLKLKLK